MKGERLGPLHGIPVSIKDLALEALLQKGIILARSAILLAQQIKFAFQRHKFGRAAFADVRLLAVIIALGNAVYGGFDALKRAKSLAGSETGQQKRQEQRTGRDLRYGTHLRQYRIDQEYAGSDYLDS